MSEKVGLYIGTSGWSYPTGKGTWKGHFYPKEKIDELGYYSRFFNTVEINSSFYMPPNPDYVYNWVRKVPSDFLFCVKLWQKFTHPEMFCKATGGDASISLADIDLFKKSIEPLLQSAKMGALLAQFPHSFKNNDTNHQIVVAVMKAFGDCRLAVELRHCSWSDDSNTMRMLMKGNASWVQIDEPKFKTSISQQLPLTSDMAYFRFHGRNAENWWTGDNETRYRYLYSVTEIEELAHKVEGAGKQAKLTFAFFNNHYQGYAPRNAIDMIKTLKLSVKEPPFQISLPDEDSSEGL
ncbi:MAG: DUF72 domain-containing protein [Dehalococcoidia bacterium]|nr:MAG: DUF72 domain-containing protein [Dehalococcoidia bacterium]